MGNTNPKKSNINPNFNHNKQVKDIYNKQEVNRETEEDTEKKERERINNEKDLMQIVLE